MQTKIKYIFLSPGYGYISMTQESMNEHVEHIHTDLSLPQDQDGKKMWEHSLSSRLVGCREEKTGTDLTIW